MENLPNFISQLENELIFKSSSARVVRMRFEEVNLAQQLEAFIADYFLSVGANLIPMSQYSNFLSLLYKKGVKVVCKVLSNFLVTRQN